jgi:hypothetical protein
VLCTIGMPCATYTQAAEGHDEVGGLPNFSQVGLHAVPCDALGACFGLFAGCWLLPK